jgi:hypothetical protein
MKRKLKNELGVGPCIWTQFFFPLSNIKSFALVPFTTAHLLFFFNQVVWNV